MQWVIAQSLQRPHDDWRHWRSSLAAGAVAAVGLEGVLLIAAALMRFGAGLPAALAGERLGVLRIWGQWDWAWYQAIATGGYEANHPRQSFPGVYQDATAFAPGFPLTVRGLSQLLHVPALDAALLVSFLCAAVAFVGLHRLATMDWDSRTAHAALALALVYPGALFLVAPYTEAPLLMCSVWAFLLVRRGRALGAGLFAAAATAVKMPWLLILVPALCVEWCASNGWRPAWRHLRVLELIVPPLLVVAVWMGWQWYTFGDPLDFLRAQSGWTPGFTPVWTVIASTFSASVRDAAGSGWLAVWVLRGLDVAACLCLLAIGVYTLLRIRRSYGVFLLAGFLVINDAGGNFLSSEIRFLVPFFPVFLAAAVLGRRHPRALRVWVLVSVALLAMFTDRFVNGLWAG